MIKAIAFDYGGVIEIKEGNLFKEIVEYLHISINDWERVYFSLNHLSNTGKITSQEVHRLVAGEFGASETQIIFIQELIKKYDKKRILNLGLIEIIKDLKKKNYKIGLLSNYSITLRDKLARQNIIDLFDEVIISSEVGFQKPQPEIFEILFNKLGIKNHETIFIDDTQNSLKNAEEIGYTPLLYVNNEKLNKDLLQIL